MLTVKYTKEGRARYLPHLDMLRHIQRTLRRAEIGVSHSVGFNPHMRIFMSNPIPLGFASRAEYFTIETEVCGEEFCRLFNQHAIEGMKICYALEMQKDPVVAALISAADYTVVGQGIGRRSAEISSRLVPQYAFSFESKGESKTVAVGEGLLGYSFDGDTLAISALAGQRSLRVDRLLGSILNEIGAPVCLDITRQRVYTDRGAPKGNLVDLDDYLKSLHGAKT